MIQITIIRSDGIFDETTYQFFLDGKQIREKIEDSEINLFIPSKGILHAVIKDKLKKATLFSVGFNTDILPSEGFQWIPLYSNSQTILTHFPEDVSNPRLLIMVSSEFLAPISEDLEQECGQCEELKKEIQKLRQEADRHTKDNKNSYDSFTAENEKNKVIAKKFQAMHAECKKELDLFKIRFEEEKKKNFELAEKVKNLGLVIEDNAQKAKMREEFLEGLINDREKEYSKASIERLRFKTQSKTDENDRSVITPFTENTLSNTYNSALPEFTRETSRQKLGKRKVLSEINNSDTNSTETFVALREYLKKSNRCGMFVREQGNMFRFGKKKVFITLKHGNLLCRVGGGFEGIEDFIAKNQENKSPGFNEKAHRRHKTVDEVQKNQEFNLAETPICRSSPEIDKFIKLRYKPSCKSE